MTTVKISFLKPITTHAQRLQTKVINLQKLKT